MKLTIISISEVTLQGCDSHCAYCGPSTPILVGDLCLLIKASTPLGEQEFYVKLDHAEQHGLEVS